MTLFEQMDAGLTTFERMQEREGLLTTLRTAGIIPVAMPDNAYTMRDLHEMYEQLTDKPQE